MNLNLTRAVALLLGTGVVAGTLAGCSRPSVASGADAPRHVVHVASIAVAPLGVTVRAVGLLAPKDQSKLAFKVGGYIETLRIEEGQQVRAGQLLAELKRTEIDAGLDQARQNAAKALRDLGRAKSLYADGVTTLEQVQDLGTVADVANAALVAAEFNARHAEIRAPGDGVVLQKLAEVNELVQAGQPVLSVGKAGRGWVVRVGLADRDVVRMRPGDAARIEFDAWPGQLFSGQVSNISSAADPATGTFTVEIPVEPGAAHFVQGLVAKVQLVPRGAPSVPVVPVQALIEANGEEAGVFVLDGGPAPGAPAAAGAERGVVHRATIRIGRMSGGEVEVRGGLEPGARVVIDGAAFLENGETVRVEAQP
jgi:RND family efflux transporter MFP subunit